MKDWIVTRYGEMSKGCYYKYWVAGHLAYDKASFFWIVPDMDNARYDMGNAVFCEDVKDYNVEKRLVIL